MNNTLLKEVQKITGIIETGERNLKGDIKYEKQKSLELLINTSQKINYNKNLKMSLKNSYDLNESITTYLYSLDVARDETYYLVKNDLISKNTSVKYHESLIELKNLYSDKRNNKKRLYDFRKYMTLKYTPLLLGLTALSAVAIPSILISSAVLSIGAIIEANYINRKWNVMDDRRFFRKLNNKKAVKKLNNFLDNTKKLITEYGYKNKKTNEKIKPIISNYKKTLELVEILDKYSLFSQTSTN